MATAVPQIEDAKPLDVDKHLRPLLSPLGDAVSGRCCIAVLSLWSPVRAAGLLPAHLHLRWAGAIKDLPLTPYFAIMPFQGTDWDLSAESIYPVLESQLARQSARISRTASNQLLSGDLRHPDWEQVAGRFRGSLPAQSYISFDRVSPISECLALRWSDVDWLNGRLRVERGIVERNVDDVKTDESRKCLVIANELLERLKLWRQTTEFSKDGDWIFASPAKIGRLPYSYTGVWRELDRASNAANLGHMGTHTFRHSYRMWIDAIGTPVGVQQRLMRHSDIRTTMNIYGDAASEDLREAHNKIVGLALHTA